MENETGTQDYPLTYDADGALTHDTDITIILHPRPVAFLLPRYRLLV